MKRFLLALLVASIPLFLLGTVWQTSRYGQLEARVDEMEAIQDDWIEENANLVGSIAVVSRREQIANWAAKLGLQKATPERRIHIVPAQGGKGGSNG